jgi:23S rRNA (adenine2503-C2)-methyltransferase
MRDQGPLHPLARLPEDWEAALRAAGERPFRAKQVFRWVHARGVVDPAQMSDLPGALRERLAAEGLGPAAAVASVRRSLDGTRKLLVTMGDGATVESVLIPGVTGPKPPAIAPSPAELDADAAAADDEDDEAAAEAAGPVRVSQCISTQVGCAMGCVFCASGPKRSWRRCCSAARTSARARRCATWS